MNDKLRIRDLDLGDFHKGRVCDLSIEHAFLHYKIPALFTSTGMKLIVNLLDSSSYTWVKSWNCVRSTAMLII